MQTPPGSALQSFHPIFKITELDFLTYREAASGQASPEAANAIPPDGRGTQRTSATSTKASTTLGPSNTSVGERGASIHEEPFLSRLTSKVPSRGRLPKQSSRLTSLGPVLNLDVTCPRLRELQVFTDLRLVSATVVSAEMRCLRAWVVSDGGGRV